MQAISNFFIQIFDMLFFVFSFGGHALAGLIVISFLTGIGMAWLFKITSNQEKIRLAKDRFKSGILEMRIYQDDLGALFGSFFSAIGSNAFYLRHSLKPILFIIVPIIVIYVQVDARYARAPFQAGDKFILTVSLNEGVNPFEEDFALGFKGDIQIDAGPVRVIDPPEISWRLAAQKAGRIDVTVSVGGDSYKFPIEAEPHLGTIGHQRRAHSFWDPFLHPGLPAIPSGSSIAGIEIRYPSASHSLFGWNTHWLVILLVYSLAGAVVAKFLFKVEI